MGMFDKFMGAVMNRVTGLPEPVADWVEYSLPDGKVVRRDLHGGSREEYFSNAYRACALAKARPLASLPVHVYERVDGARRESGKRVAKALSSLLRTRWNPFVSATEGIRWLDMTKDAKGNAFVRVEWSGGKPVALWPMSSMPGVGVDSRTGKPVFEYQGDKFTPSGKYLSHEVVWVKSPVLDSDCLYGRSLAELAARELNMSIDLEEFYSEILNGGDNFPGWLGTDQKLNDQDVKRLQSDLAGGRGVLGAGKIRIFDKGLTYHSVGGSMVDMSLIEQEKWILQQTCRTLSVPPQEVFDLSNATYSNIEQGALNFANKTLVPEAAEIERAFSSVLWECGLTDCYVQFDMNGLLRGNYRDRMEGYRIGVYSGFLSRNEVRAKEDMAPYEGGDDFLLPTSYVSVDAGTGEVTQLADSGAADGAGFAGERDPTDPGGDSTGALDAIHEDMAARVRARFDEDGDTEKFREFASRVLTPYANACLIARIDYDMQSDIERITR